MLWPEHAAVIDAWVAELGCGRSEAVRMIIQLAPAPTSQGAKNAAAALAEARERIRLEALAARPVEERAAKLRQRKAAEARARRVKLRTVKA